MDRIKDGINGARSTIDDEYENIRRREDDHDASQAVRSSLEKIENTLGDLNDRIKKGAFDISATTRKRVDEFGSDLDELQERIRSQRNDIREKGLEQKTDEVLNNVRDRYNKMVDRFLKV